MGLREVSKMDGYTLKALLTIALYVVLDAMLNFPRTWGLRQSLAHEVGEFWHSLAMPLHTLHPIKVKTRTRRYRI